MSHPFFIVNAFVGNTETSHLLGNPAAVVVLNKPQSDEWLQRVAAEFNLSETAFLWPNDKTDAAQAKHFKLRWFTPTCEVKLCGHATLASVEVLVRELKNPVKDFQFSTLSGELKASVTQEKIYLVFPRTPLKRCSNLFVQDSSSGISRLNLSVELAYQADDYLLIETENEALVANYQPDFNALTQIDAKGIIVTAPSAHSDLDFVSRFFAPRLGVNEDPVTGSAHCALAPYWGQKLDKNFLRAQQLSVSGGYVEMELQEKNVTLIGKCKTFAQGNLCSN